MHAFTFVLASYFFVIHGAHGGPNRAEPAHEFFVWNVGQGLWSTYVTGDTCIHFDMGGEQAPWKAIAAVCGAKFNQVHLTHWDLDHLSFISRVARELKFICLQTPPMGFANQKKQDLLAKLKMCQPKTVPSQSLPLYRPLLNDKESSSDQEHSSNDLSQVYLAGAHAPILIPGDSTTKRERQWLKNLPPQGAWLLVLGHHGSRTSTSPELLSRLKFTRMAIASSRQARYGHPHPEVRDRLKLKGIALLKTEDWGTLRFEVPLRLPETRDAQSRIVTEKRTTDDKAYTQGSSYERRAHRSRDRRKRSSP